jgi:hypothetical protein
MIELLLPLVIISPLLVVLSIAYISLNIGKRREATYPTLVGITGALIPIGLFVAGVLVLDFVTVALFTFVVSSIATFVGIVTVLVGEMRDTFASPRNRTPLILGFGGGVGAWLSGYLMTYVLLGNEGRRFTESLIADRFWDGDPVLALDPSVSQLVGWVYYSMHLSNIQITTQTASLTTNIIGGDGLTPLLLVIPPSVLFITGYSVARFTIPRNYEEIRPIVGIAEGATILPGYFSLMLVGQYFFWIGGLFTLPAGGPSLPIFGAIVFPVVFGSAGGLCAVLHITQTAKSQ